MTASIDEDIKAVKTAVERTPKKELILEEALRIVMANRQIEYGTPAENFGLIAKYWSVYFTAANGFPQGFSQIDVIVMMILLKIARAQTGVWARDHLVDIAGYAECGAMVLGLDKHG